MAKIDSMLEPNERIQFAATISRATFLPAIALTTGGALFCFVALDIQPSSALGLFSAFLLLSAFSLLLAVIEQRTSKLIITNQRVLTKKGLIRQHTIEIPHRQFESASIRQSTLGRILNYGTVIVSGTGGNITYMHNVEAPFELRQAVVKAKEGERTHRLR